LVKLTKYLTLGRIIIAALFYDEQIKRFLIQFARIFSNWEVTAGYDERGNPIIKRVPIMYGDSSRQAAAIVANNSSNNLPSAPLITYYITGIDFEQSRTQDPYFIDTMDVRQRAYNSETGDWETTQGNAFTVERLMPVPYRLSISVDFWTTNYLQKLEIFEQLAVLFNPSMEIQSTDNFIDWTSLSVVYQDGISWTSRSVPVGSGNPIDILSWKFYIPIWISSPIKVRKLGIIQRIIASIFKGKYKDDIQDEDLLLGTRQKITPYGYKLLLLENQLQILPADQPLYPPNSEPELPESPNTNVYWHSVLNAYGVIRPGISMIALENPYLETEIMGSIAYNPTDDRLLVFNIDPDTVPQNTLQPVDSVINPLQKYPGEGLPAPAVGQRYLIVEDIPEQLSYLSPSPILNAWPGLSSGAKINDIIQFDGSNWNIVFNSSTHSNVEFVTNVTTGVQYRFTADEGWIKSVEGWYGQGEWRIII
jgi:hypothetical protein